MRPSLIGALGSGKILAVSVRDGHSIRSLRPGPPQEKPRVPDTAIGANVRAAGVPEFWQERECAYLSVRERLIISEK